MDEEEDAFTHLVFYAEEGDESRPRETEAEQEGGDDSEPRIITVQADVHEPPETSIEVKERKYDSNKTSKTKDKMEDLGNVHPKITTKKTKDCDDPEIMPAPLPESSSTKIPSPRPESSPVQRFLLHVQGAPVQRFLLHVQGAPVQNSFSTSRELQDQRFLLHFQGAPGQRNLESHQQQKNSPRPR
ncbi:uncharacterized protein [Bemisia tabaci]|uniref:uncharacterized protein n=1 Tax=Bemisia tabaci TaxID=7038 RepID=UPI003B28AE4B